MPRISFASTTAKLCRLFLHPKSTLIREYSPRGNSQKPWVIQTCLHHPFTFLRKKCGLKQLLPKCSRCLGYSNYTGDTHQETGHVTFHRWLVFIVSAALSQSKTWRAQSSSIWITPCQNTKSQTRQDCIHPLPHLMNLSASLSHPSQRAASQICAPRFLSSLGYKYRRGRIFGGQPRPENSQWEVWSLKWGCTRSYLQTWWGVVQKLYCWECRFDMVRSLESLPRGPTSLVLRNLTGLGSGRIFHSQVSRWHRVQVFSLYPPE